MQHFDFVFETLRMGKEISKTVTAASYASYTIQLVVNQAILHIGFGDIEFYISILFINSYQAITIYIMITIYDSIAIYSAIVLSPSPTFTWELIC